MDASFAKKIGSIALAAVVFFATFSAWALTPVEVTTLVAAEEATVDKFGYSVAVHGDTAVIGVPYGSCAGIVTGTAYVFTLSGGTWTQQAELAALDGADDDNFGYSVAVYGDTAVIGAPCDSDSGTCSGAAYLFARSNGIWEQAAKLTAADGVADDNFGYSVALNGDIAVIGAPYAGRVWPQYYCGSAYVFSRSVSSVTNEIAWKQQAKLTASDGESGDNFGTSVAVYGDTAVIGAPYNDSVGRDSGSTYVFTGSNGIWEQTAKLTASDEEAGDRFGYSVALDGDTAVIGMPNDSDAGTRSGSAYVFTGSDGIWEEEAKLTAADGESGDSFGHSVAVSGDTATIGVPYYDDNDLNSGSVYLFSRSVGFWEEQVKLSASAGASNDNFGYSVAMHGDTVVIGVPYHLLNHTVGTDDSYALDYRIETGLAHVFRLASDDAAFKPETVIKTLGTQCELSVNILTSFDIPGLKGLIAKLTGNGSFYTKVSKAVDKYENGQIDACTLSERLNSALHQLNAYENQLESKIKRSKISVDQRSGLRAGCKDMRSMIAGLEEYALSACLDD
jgi:hypothetical protein